MRELIEITEAFAALVADGKPSALATVIRIEGSSFRRPGARMLISEDGRTWGGVSGGCLERDVARRGREVINSRKCQRVSYDTADDESLATGVATGCGGAVEIFIQPLDAALVGPMNIFRDVISRRRGQSISTIIESSSVDERKVGSVLPTGLETNQFESSAPDAAPVWLDPSYGQLKQVDIDKASVLLFVERIQPPQPITIVGAGPDARAVAVIAKGMGWHVTVVAAYPAIGIHERFHAIADKVVVTSSESPLEGIEHGADAAVVLMTHNLARDQAALTELPKELAYLGFLGPKHRTDRILRGLGQSNRDRSPHRLG